VAVVDQLVIQVVLQVLVVVSVALVAVAKVVVAAHKDLHQLIMLMEFQELQTLVVVVAV
jgi:hypothetical protein